MKALEFLLVLQDKRNISLNEDFHEGVVICKQPVFRNQDIIGSSNYWVCFYIIATQDLGGLKNRSF